MDITRPCPLAGRIAGRIREARDELTARWLERIAARVSLDEQRIFPSEELLDHVPILMVGIADYLEDPTDEITADVPVIAKAMELGELRFSQGFDATEILKEYEILGGVLFAFSSGVLAEGGETCAAEDMLICAHRLFRAISVIEQTTTAQYLRVLGERVGEREERLRRFSRMITHELKNRVGATLGAGQLLQEEWLGDEERQKFAGMVSENAQEIQKVLENLVALSRLDGERRRQRNIMLPEVVAEVFRQLRELARARQVQLRVAGELPGVEVNAAAVELCLSNYVSNAIKYSDPSQRDRHAAVDAVLEDVPGTEHGCELVVRVRDNGLGVPEDRRERLFERFYRAHADHDRVEGTGLGLNLVQETAESMGGRAWAELDQSAGAVFAFALPVRRSSETPADAEADAVDAAGQPETPSADAPAAGAAGAAGAPAEVPASRPRGGDAASAPAARRRQREGAAPGKGSG
jgi:signal transduction histidine kinase